MKWHLWVQVTPEYTQYYFDYASILSQNLKLNMVYRLHHRFNLYRIFKIFMFMSHEPPSTINN